MPSPSDRAKKIWNVVNHDINDTKPWDLICFCVETLGYLQELIADPAVAARIKELNLKVYSVHYARFDEIIAMEKKLDEQWHTAIASNPS